MNLSASRSASPLRAASRWLPAVLLALCAGTSVAGSLVRMTTPVGSMTLELFDKDRPVTVQNFLTYIKKGRYAETLSHRLLTNFVLQGGGFALKGNTIEAVKTFDPIKNEYDGRPAFSNVKGTITMAKVDGNPNSATSQWFINLKNNNTGAAESGNLDLQNGGFTVFGRVVTGLTTLDVINDDFSDADTAVRGVYDCRFELEDGNFQNTPLMASRLSVDNLFYTSFEIVYEELPTVKTKAKVRVRKATAILKGKATPGSSLLQWRVGAKGKVQEQKLTNLAWQVKAGGLKAGENVVYLRAVTASGGQGAYRAVKVIRK